MYTYTLNIFISENNSGYKNDVYFLVFEQMPKLIKLVDLYAQSYFKF